MFDSLSNRLNEVFDRLRGRGALSEDDVAAALREIRIALLEADVALPVVRDFVNIFFIFVLLYIAFATILSLHGFKTKEMIINVIIIGLLMNFSLFAGQLIKLFCKNTIGFL